MKVKIADCVFEIRPHFSYAKAFFKEYCVDESISCTDRMTAVEVTGQEIAREQEGYEEIFDSGYLETLAILRKLAENFAAMDIALFHGVAMVWKDKCYLLTAKSGTGKSTHAFLWKKNLGEQQVKIINGDKPFIRQEADGLWVYGTPWCGKEGLHMNEKARLGGVIFLERGSQNTIRRLAGTEITGRLLSQLYLTERDTSHLLCICDKIVKTVPCYSLCCDISREAVKVCFEGVTGENFENYAGKEEHQCD